MNKLLIMILASSVLICGQASGTDSSIVYPGGKGPGNGKHVVFVTGDEEYRSEEGLPMLAKILSQRHGFKCTVLFALDPDGTINPDNQKSLPGAAALDSADAIVMLTRYRAWPAEEMKHFVDAFRRGVPIVALRTSTHAFKNDQGPYQSFNTFGKRVLGEQWVNHWGSHKSEATRGIIEPAAKDHPLLRGVSDVFGNTDVYEAYPPADATILLRGQVLKGMHPDDPPADYLKKRSSDQKQQPINDPMMPVAWTRIYKNEAGHQNRILCTTMGAATDLQNEGLRRLIVNGVYWGLKLNVPEKADVRSVGEYKPTMYGFQGYRKGVKPSDLALGAPQPATRAAALQLAPGAHIAIIGNALPDRMQHDGWLQTLIYARFPNHRLVFRNLAVAGDEIVTRHRSENFGTPDDWLTRTKADVIFAFFGFNESFKGEAGLPAFKTELDKFLKTTAAKNYSGNGPPQIVLFSPIPNEYPSSNNANIQRYAEAMREVAAADGVRFVDLFAPVKALYAQHEEPLTVNGLHLTQAADRLLAPIIFQSLFGAPAPAGDFEKLRAAVIDKNEQWHARYRTVDGYNVYGGRSRLAFPSTQPGKEITNFHVMQEEMTQRDVLTANRDPRIWAVAQGKDFIVDDSDLPPVDAVPSNEPGTESDGTHSFLSGEEAIAKMKVQDGCRINLFASEEQFPELINPVQMAWDTKSRLWVAAWRNYPERTPTSTVGDSLLILEDTDGDGHADKCTHYLDDLNCPTGFQFYKDGVLVMEAPDLWFARDTDGDGRADSIQRILMGMDSADTHHTANSMVLDPGGATYLSDGVFHRTQVETALGPVRNDDAGIYRFEPRTGKFERYIAYDFANPHGRVFDYWGNDLVTDATGNNTYFGPAFSGRLDYPQKHREMKEFWNRPSRPSPGTGLLTSRHFPAEFQGDLLNLNVLGFQGIYRVKIVEDGSGLRGERQPDLVSSTDPNFRPTAVNVGPDGAIYFADWHNPIIGHMQHHIRDPNRDHTHGRIYRITYDGRPLMTPPQIDGQPIPALLDLLKEPENQTRTLAKIELAKRPTAEVMTALGQWIKSLDPKDPAFEHHMTEALWVHQWQDVVDVDLLKRMLNSPEPRARAAATRVLCYWRDRVPDALALLAPRADDDNPRVRLEAVRAASFFGSLEAENIALQVLKHPSDYYIHYTLGETTRQLQRYWRDAILAGKPLAPGNPAGLNFLIGTLSSADLLKFPRFPGVVLSVLCRPDVVDAERHKALAELSAQRKTNRATVLLGVLRDAGDDAARANAAHLLPQLTPSDLKPLRTQLVELSRGDGDAGALVRQYAWAALATADEKFDAVWKDASRSAASLAELVEAVPLVYDPFIRARAYEKVMPLLAPQAPAGSTPALRQAAIGAAASINRNHDKTFAALAALIERGEQIPAAAAGLRRLPRAQINPQQCGAIVAALVKWAQAVPADQRTSADYLSTVQFAEGLIPLLPQARAADAMKDLRALRVAVYIVTALREQMRYDTPRLIVEAGKPLEIRFDNEDFMPHNLTILRPGARERTGKLAAAGGPNAGAFVPDSADVVAATRMLDSGQRQTLKLTAPEVEGAYEYVCTFPEHWKVMFGRLIVTRDIDAYLKAHPDSGEPPAPVAAEHTAHGGHHGG
jgi:putative membrane-bound dehydrogenase-like protein